MLVPRLLIVPHRLVAPWPMATTRITTPTPIIMPRIVREVRILCSLDRAPRHAYTPTDSSYLPQAVGHSSYYDTGLGVATLSAPLRIVASGGLRSNQEAVRTPFTVPLELLEDLVTNSAASFFAALQFSSSPVIVKIFGRAQCF